MRCALICLSIYAGVGIIDFEHWRPIWNENFGSLAPYRKESRSIEKSRHPYYTNAEVEKEVSYKIRVLQRYN